MTKELIKINVPWEIPPIRRTDLLSITGSCQSSFFETSTQKLQPNQEHNLCVKNKEHKTFEAFAIALRDECNKRVPHKRSFKPWSNQS